MWQPTCMTLYGFLAAIRQADVVQREERAIPIICWASAHAVPASAAQPTGHQIVILRIALCHDFAGIKPVLHLLPSRAIHNCRNGDRETICRRCFPESSVHSLGFVDIRDPYVCALAQERVEMI